MCREGRVRERERERERGREGKEKTEVSERTGVW